MKLARVPQACLLLITAIIVHIVPAAATPAPDGVVTGLNAPVFASLSGIKARSPSILTETDVRELAAAINKDGTIDPVEEDLLAELTQNRIRSVTITRQRARDTDRPVVLFPQSGNRARMLKEVLSPRLDLSAQWAKPDHGWVTLLGEFQREPSYQPALVDFVAARLGEQWALSNMANAYRPLRDDISKCYDMTMRAGGTNVSAGRILLFGAMDQLDRKQQDRVPDFLYNWIKPGDYTPVR